MRVIFGLLLVLSVVYCAAATHTGGVGPSNGAYTGVPAGWTCNFLWFNELQRIDSGEYDQYKGKNLTALFGAPIGTSVPSLSNWGCDCQCGVWDPDCDQPARTLSTADSRDLTKMSCVVNRIDWGEPNPEYTTCQPSTANCAAVPNEWFCEPNWYNENASGNSRYQDGTIVCDCGCGAYDPDCAVLSGASDFPQLFSCSRDAVPVSQPSNQICAPLYPTSETRQPPAKCMSVPAAWTCDPHLYDQAKRGFSNAQCDCGCGVWDPDCDSQADSFSLGLPLSCDGALVSSPAFCMPTSLSCVIVPNGWTCPAVRWNERLHTATDNTPVCDCGCGIHDPDCDLNIGALFNTPNGVATLADNVAIRCGAAAPPSRDFPRMACSRATDTCVPVPAGWQCTPRWYDEANTMSLGPNNAVDCDCGCGIIDPDCKVDGAPLFCGINTDESTDDEQWCFKQRVPVTTAAGRQEEVHGVCKTNAGSASTIAASFFVLFAAFLASSVF